MVTLIAVVMTVLTARVFFKRLAPVHVWGSIGGGMTSSAALTTIRRAADDSNEPALSYAAAYAVLIFLMLFTVTRIGEWRAKVKEERELAAAKAAQAASGGAH